MSEELRELAREHPQEFESVAEKIGGDVERWLRNILEEEQEAEANGVDV